VPRSLTAGVASLAVAGLLCAAPVPTPRGPVFVDLGPHANAKLNQPFHGDRAGNDLAALPTGKQTFAGVPFVVGDSVVQLGSTLLPGKPKKVTGIKVGSHAARLHFFHSCGHSGGTPEGTVVARYVVHYEDDSTATIEVVWGRDVKDWWIAPGERGPTKSKVGWEGENALVKATGSKIQISVTTWENPSPAKKIVSLDYVAADNVPAAAFCVAITAEVK
jgi:hypothetical protein